VVILSRRWLSTSPPSPEMHWNARLNAAGKQRDKTTTGGFNLSSE
jgi:hypothetical protein